MYGEDCMHSYNIKDEIKNNYIQLFQYFICLRVCVCARIIYLHHSENVELVIENLLDFINSFEDVGVTFALGVFHDVQLDGFDDFFHFLEFLFDLILLLGLARDFFDDVLVRLVLIHEHHERGIFGHHFPGDVAALEDLRPVLHRRGFLQVSQCLRCQQFEHPEFLTESCDVVLQLLRDLRGLLVASRVVLIVELLQETLRV